MKSGRPTWLLLPLVLVACSSSGEADGGTPEPGAGGTTGGMPPASGGMQSSASGGGTALGGSSGQGGASEPECVEVEAACGGDEDCCMGHCLGGRCELPVCRTDGDCVYDWECCEYCHVHHCH